MTASDHLNPVQFMPVSDLLDLHSDEALHHQRNWTGNSSMAHSDLTKVREVYASKADEMSQHPAHFAQLDSPIRSGSIDPVLLARSSSGLTIVHEGHHRIVRADQLGVAKLPVSYDPASQRHRDDWPDW